jgi:hypothetical protein
VGLVNMLMWMFDEWFTSLNYYGLTVVSISFTACPINMLSPIFVYLAFESILLDEQGSTFHNAVRQAVELLIVLFTGRCTAV